MATLKMWCEIKNATNVSMVNKQISLISILSNGYSCITATIVVNQQLKAFLILPLIENAFSRLRWL